MPYRISTRGSICTSVRPYICSWRSLSVRPSVRPSFRLFFHFFEFLLFTLVIQFLFRSTSKFGYKDYGVERIQIFKNGAPVSSCSELMNMDTRKRNSHTHVYLHENMIRVFGKSATCISIDDFSHAFFLYCVSLAPNPRVANDYGVTEVNSERKLSFVEAATIDIEITFRSVTTTPLYAMFLGLFDVSISLNELGLVNEQ